MKNLKIGILACFLLILFFVSCNSAQQKVAEAGKENDTLLLLKQGDSITNRVQKLLLTNVMQAINEGGPSNAVAFCNVHAMPLTDSLAEEYNCLIQRYVI